MGIRDRSHGGTSSFGHEGCGANPHGADAVVEKARAYAKAKGVPFTPMRERVLREIAGSGKPLTAYELADRVSDARKVAAVQIYRALEFLEAAGVVHRLASRAAWFACGHEHGVRETVVFMICEECGAVQETASPLVGQGLEGAAKSTGFRARHPIVEVEGECGACAERMGR